MNRTMLAVINQRTSKRQFTAILRRLNKAMFEPSDPTRFIGEISPDEDSLAYQQAIRDEKSGKDLPTAPGTKAKRAYRTP